MADRARRRRRYLLQLDPLTFAERWRSRLDLPSGQRGHAATNLALSGRWMTGAYVVHTENRLDNVCQRIDLAAFDPDGTRRATAHLLPFAGATGSSCFATGVLVRSPFAPAALAGTASGSTVTLDWEDPGDTTAFEVEYGFAPGQHVGVLRVGPTSQLAIPGVPPGTYYVRVRGRNEVGGSPPSNEVRVVVQ